MTDVWKYPGDKKLNKASPAKPREYGSLACQDVLPKNADALVQELLCKLEEEKRRAYVAEIQGREFSDKLDEVAGELKEKDKVIEQQENLIAAKEAMIASRNKKLLETETLLQEKVQEFRSEIADRLSDEWKRAQYKIEGLKNDVDIAHDTLTSAYKRMQKQFMGVSLVCLGLLALVGFFLFGVPNVCQ